MSAKFSLGKVVATPGVLDALADANENALPYLNRHMAGDWGDMCKEDCQVNEDALVYGNRTHSSYKLSNGIKIWIITEADRSVTTVFLPDEY